MLLGGTYITDTIGRDNCRFTAGALIGSLWDTAEMGGMPALVNHDFTRPLGWNELTAVVFKPGITRVIGKTIVPDNREENQNLSQRIGGYLAYILQVKQAVPLEDLRQRIGDRLKGDETPLSLEATAFVGPGLAERVFPEVFAKRTDEGLVPLSTFDAVGPGVFRIGELLVFAHRFLRRSFHPLNTLNDAFLTGFQALEAEGVIKQIRLDPDTVGLASSFRNNRMERSLWAYGAPFTDDIPTIDKGVHRFESNDMEKFFFSIARTECFWYHREGFHSFEAEELRDQPMAQSDRVRYGCRYVHAMVPEGTNEPSHFDGALRIYEENELVERLDTDLMRAERNTEYVKLWRLDGPIPLTDWKRLLADYYRDNPHVGEYLGGQPITPERIGQDPKPAPTPRERLVPYATAKTDGLRVMLGFKPLFQAPAGRRIIPTLAVETADGPSSVLELDALDLVKVLLRLNRAVTLPDAYLVGSALDEYVCYPVIHHAGENVNQYLAETMEALATLFEARLAIQEDFVGAFTLRFPVGELDAAIAYVGPGASLLRLLKEIHLIPPTSFDALREWGDQLGEWLENNDQHSDAGPDEDDLLGEAGGAAFIRQVIPDEICRLWTEDGEVRFELSVAESQADLLEAVRAGSIAVGLNALFEGVLCRTCNIDYRECGCCRWLDRDCRVEAQQILVHGAHWTDRQI